MCESVCALFTPPAGHLAQTAVENPLATQGSRNQRVLSFRRGERPLAMALPFAVHGWQRVHGMTDRRGLVPSHGSSSVTAGENSHIFQSHPEPRLAEFWFCCFFSFAAKAFFWRLSNVVSFDVLVACATNTLHMHAHMHTALDFFVHRPAYIWIL